MNRNFEYLEHIEFLPSDENPMFFLREHNKVHTTYETEVMLFSAIMHGDEQELKEIIDYIMSGDVVIGRFSHDNIRQMKYWAVCNVTLAVRYAIQGGLDENEAFCFSDDFIMRVDEMENEKEIFDFIYVKAFELTSLVARVNKSKNYPGDIRKCISFISANLHKNITVEMLARECGLSRDYLSLKFKKVVGERPSAYIRKQKLAASKEMLLKGFTCSQTAYFMNFCSESYYIECFKKEYGITPKKYQSNSTSPIIELAE